VRNECLLRRLVLLEISGIAPCDHIIVALNSPLAHALGPICFSSRPNLLAAHAVGLRSIPPATIGDIASMPPACGRDSLLSQER
jgi:hypothetical protein